MSENIAFHHGYKIKKEKVAIATFLILKLMYNKIVVKRVIFYQEKEVDNAGSKT